MTSEQLIDQPKSTVSRSSSTRLETYPLIMKVQCTQEEITVLLDDGRKMSIPTAWYPRTRKATLSQLQNCRIISDRYGIHWPEIDEHLSIRAFFQGLRGK